MVTRKNYQKDRSLKMVHMKMLLKWLRKSIEEKCGDDGSKEILDEIELRLA